ncbi:PREDICTED: transcription initiation factor TFIID subunit 4b-like [Ipomoea nil]|uniref:transcription initiation factor TFIID subunit 4b-like n=1 Tax=Ipomoea nil TaxID=35883 RepID=UPI0009013A00|nr:PREDICTED: transcription initiation factor TFIID subunit 4b-like [Ipomoea nil]
MDASIMKLLEEDEDETLHSMADLEAFTAALDRDIGSSSPLPSASDAGNACTSSQFMQWQTTTSLGQNTMSQSLQDSRDMLQREQNSSELMLKQHCLDAGNQYQKDSCLDANQPPWAEETFRAMEVQNSGNDPVPIQEQNGTQNPESQHLNIQSFSTQQSISIATSGQLTKLNGTSGQQITTTGVTSQKEVLQSKSSQPMVNVPKKGMQLPFALLVPHLQTQVDKDRGMQLETLYLKLKKNEISKDVFVRHMRSIIGDHMLKMAILKFQYQTARNTEKQASAQQQQQTLSNVQIPTDVNNLKMESRECQADLQRTPENQVSSSGLSAIKQEEHLPFPIQGLSKQQQQHLHFPRASFSTYVNKGNNNNTCSATNSSSTPAYAKPQHQDLHIRPICAQQSIGATQLRPGTYSMNMINSPNTERKGSLGEPRRAVTHTPSNSMAQQNSVQWQSSTNKEQRNIPVDHFPELQHKSQISSPSISVQGGSTVGTSKDLQSSRMGFSTSASDGPSNFRSTPMSAQVDTSSLLNSCKPPVTSPNEPGNNGKTPLKNPSIGQKKPLETLGSMPPPPSKKQKVSGDLLGQSIEQLNDVAAVSGVNLREEEEQLFSGANEDGRVSEASKRVVQEEEERLILQKFPLQKKLTEIMRKCGIKNRSSDVERCLSLCVEERMRALMTTLIRFSKQRVDIEKLRHRTIPTSDVRKQIMVINERAKVEWEKKQAEIAKFQKTNESEDDTAADGDKEKDEGHVKSGKVNKGEDEKTRATAANVAARAAIGGDDMLSKWQLMAQQARQKRDGSGLEGASDSQSRKDVAWRPVSILNRNTSDPQESEKGATSPTGTMRKFGKNKAVMSQIARTITIKDVIAALEMEPQMSRSTLVYRLYERIRFDASTE